jgi:hypothetical protein
LRRRSFFFLTALVLVLGVGVFGFDRLLGWDLALGFTFDVIICKIAVLAQPLGVVGSVSMLAVPCLLGPSLSVIAVLTHIFGVVLGLFVWAAATNTDGGLEHFHFDFALLAVLLFFLATITGFFQNRLLNLAAPCVRLTPTLGILGQIVVVYHHNRR